MRFLKGTGTPAPANPSPAPTIPPTQTPTPTIPPATNPGGTATQVPPSPSPSPTKDPCADGKCTPTPTPTNERLDKAEERILAIKQAVQANHGDFPIELVLAIASQETGPTYDWDNEVANGDGIMQVTVASGYHERNGLYENTRAGIEANIRDAMGVLNERLAAVHAGWRDGYGNIFDTLSYSAYIQSTLQYNGGPNPVNTYQDGLGAPNYLARIAGGLENIVPTTFGYSNPSLVSELREGQTRLNPLISGQ